MQAFRDVFALLLAGVCASPAFAQTVPNKPIQIFTGAAAGAADILAREQAQALTAALGVPAVVQNRGGNTAIPATLVARAAPDGATLLSIGNGFWLQPLLRDDVSFDPVKDLAPVTLSARTPNILVVSNALPVQNVRELIAYARANPGKLNYGHGGAGTGNHMAAELFKSMARVNLVSVAYKGGPPAMNAMLGGEVQVFFPGVNTVLVQIKAGKIRALGVTSEQRTDLAPGMPTVSESGLPGFQSGVDYVVFATGRTPPEIIDRLSRIIAQHLRSPEVKAKLFNIGAEVIASTPAELGATMKADIESMGRIIREQGIRGE